MSIFFLNVPNVGSLVSLLNPLSIEERLIQTSPGLVFQLSLESTRVKALYLAHGIPNSDDLLEAPDAKIIRALDSAFKKHGKQVSPRYTLLLQTVIKPYLGVVNETGYLNEAMKQWLATFTCSCFRSLRTMNGQQDMSEAAVEWILQTKGILPICPDLIMMHYYRRDMKCKPGEYGTFSFTSFLEYVNNSVHADINPEGYCSETRVKLGTKHLDELVKASHLYSGTKTVNCGICLEELVPKQSQVIELVPCKHLFHANASDCLETKNIVSWLEKETFCPLCRTKVEIVPPLPTAKKEEEEGQTSRKRKHDSEEHDKPHPGSSSSSASSSTK